MHSLRRVGRATTLIADEAVFPAFVYLVPQMAVSSERKIENSGELLYVTVL
jgi:hypothetical protein